MSDEQMPAWIEAFETRLMHRVIATQKDLEVRLTAKIEGAEHAIIEEVGRAIPDAERRLSGETKAGFERVRDDVTVAVGSVDRLQMRSDTDRGDLAQLRETIAILHRKLRNLEQHVYSGGSKPPPEQPPPEGA